MQKLLLAPKPLIAICTVLILFSFYVIAINFKVVAIFRFLLTALLLYKVLSGSKVAAYILAALLLFAGFFALYLLYFLFATLGFQNFFQLTYSKYLTYSLISAFCLGSFIYILFLSRIKGFYATKFSA